MKRISKVTIYRQVTPKFKRIYGVKKITAFSGNYFWVTFRYRRAETYDSIRKQINEIVNKNERLNVRAFVGAKGRDELRYDYSSAIINIKNS